MKKKIINVFLMALLAMVTVGTVVSCKDYEEDNYSDLNGKITVGLEDLIKDLEDAKKDLQIQLDGLRAELGTPDESASADNTIYVRIVYLEKMIEEFEERIGTLETFQSNYEGKINEMYTLLYGTDGSIGAIEDLYNKVGSNESSITTLRTDLDKLVENLGDDINAESWGKLLYRIDSACTATQTNYAAIQELQGIIGEGSDYNNLLKELTETLKDAEGNKISLDEFINQKLENYDIVSSEDLQTALNDMSIKYDARFQDLSDSIKDVMTDLETLSTDLYNKLGLVSNSLNKYVSSVLIQGTDNPVFGSFAFPANISSNVLAAYYGDVKDLKFPTNEPYNYVDAQNALTAKDLEMMGAAASNQYFYNGRVVSGMQADGTVAAGNAGTLYLTVNPNTVNAEGTTAVLVNSQDVPSGVLLSPLKRSDKVLNFGYTRAANNGFYEAAATVAPDAVDGVSPRISYDDLKGLKDEIKDAVNAIRNKGNVDITGLIYSVYSISSNILDAQAAKFSWLDDSLYLAEDGKSYLVKQIERSTYTQYALAATAVHPLSFAFAKDVHYDEFPGINKVEDIIGDMFNKIEDAIPTIDVDDVNIHIEIEDFVFNPVELEEGSVMVNVDIVDEETGKHYKQNIDLTDKVEEAVNEALGSEGASEDVTNYIKDVVGQLNSQVRQINDIIDQLRDINEIGNKLDEIEDKIYDYLSKGENLLLKFVNNANELLQPMMLAKTADSYVVLSRSASAPTKFSASSMTSDGIILRPTTYSAEVLAPAFKKFVGVANVYKDGKSAQGGDANCQAALKAANSSSEGFCTVQEGDWNKAQFKVSSQYKKGYVYEIVYTAADYSGKIVVKRFYIELV